MLLVFVFLMELVVQFGEGYVVFVIVVENFFLEIDFQFIFFFGGFFSELLFYNGEFEESYEQFLKVLQNVVIIFVNCMKSNYMWGCSIINDLVVFLFFQFINGMYLQLLELFNQLDECRLYYEGLQDKLVQICDVWGVLSVLCEEYWEKFCWVVEEVECQCQIQLVQKLEIMWQKKQEYLEVQRQLVIQCLQEQEKEWQLWLEQQKQMVQMCVQMFVFFLFYVQFQVMFVVGGVFYQFLGLVSFFSIFSFVSLVEGFFMYGVYMSQLVFVVGFYVSMFGIVVDFSMVSVYMYLVGVIGVQVVFQVQVGFIVSFVYLFYQFIFIVGYQNVVFQVLQSFLSIFQFLQFSIMGYMGSQLVFMGYQFYNMQNFMIIFLSQDVFLLFQQFYIMGQQFMYQQMVFFGGFFQQQFFVVQQLQVQGLLVQGSEVQFILFD